MSLWQTGLDVTENIDLAKRLGKDYYFEYPSSNVIVLEITQ